MVLRVAEKEYKNLVKTKKEEHRMSDDKDLVKYLLLAGLGIFAYKNSDRLQEAIKKLTEAGQILLSGVEEAKKLGEGVKKT